MESIYSKTLSYLQQHDIIKSIEKITDEQSLVMLILKSRTIWRMTGRPYYLNENAVFNKKSLTKSRNVASIYRYIQEVYRYREVQCIQLHS